MQLDLEFLNFDYNEISIPKSLEGLELTCIKKKTN
jgi:hypothetical protein